jgi:hypothetical protein
MTDDEWRAHVARLAAVLTAIQGRTVGWSAVPSASTSTIPDDGP